MSTPRKIRCGVVGVGYLGQHHARLYAALPQAELVGIFETNDARAAEICARFNCRRLHTLAEVAQECEAVSVVVPTDRHCEVALPLLEAGRHLLIEKPLCTSLDEASRILKAAEARGALVQVGHIEHFNPVMGWLEKEVFQPRFIQADRLAPYQPRGTEVGVTLDLMIHDIGIVLQLANSPVERIEAVGLRVMSRTEDIANARIVFRNGCVANLNTSRVSSDKMRRIQVFQPSAQLTMDFMNQEGWLLKKVGDTLQREHVPLVRVEPLRAELESFLDSVARRKAPAISGEFGRDALSVALEVTRQIQGTFGGENLAPVKRYITAASPNRRVSSSTFLRPPAGGRCDLLVVAGEHSGDQHAAAAVRALLAREPGLRVCALGGPALKEAGAQLLLDMTQTAVVGFSEVVRHLGHFWRVYRKTIDWIATYQPRAVCFVDYPGLNLRLARALAARGITRKGGGNTRALYYISPQVWAWKEHRRHAMARSLDALGVIFPFEVDVFRDTGLPAEFVGHPFLSAAAFRPLQWDPAGPVLILPGSRAATVEHNLPVMLEAAERRLEAGAQEPLAIVYPDEAVRSVIEREIARRPRLEGRISLRSHLAVTGGRAALTTSGTMSLHCALAGIPSAIVYRMSGLSYAIAKRVAKVSRIGIANLLLREDLCPEYIQDRASPEALVAELDACLGDPKRLEQAQAGAKRLEELLADKGLGVGEWLAKQLT